MTCKDCFLYQCEICDGYIPTDFDKDIWHYCAQGKQDEIPDIEERCSSFKLKSRIVELPCAVGDTVYSFIHRWKIEDGIAPYQITNIAISQNKKGVWTKKYRAMRVIEGKTIDWQINFCFEEIGKTVFLTKEEAEKALAERSKGK